MKYEVTCSRYNGPRGLNPFRHISMNKKIERLVRKWTFEAESEKAVQALFAAAQADGHENVRGFVIDSIREL